MNEWLTPHFAHRVPSLCEEWSVGCWRERRGGGRTQFCDTLCVGLGIGRGWMGWDGRESVGGGKGRQDGIIYPCCEITDRIYRRRRGSGP